MLRSALRFIAGAIVGAFLFVWAGDAYHAVLARVTEPVVNIDSRLRHAEVRATGGTAVSRGDDEEPSLPRILIPVDQLTYNVVLLFGLFATNAAFWRRKALARFAAALLALFIVHVFALAVSIEATYAARVPGWSDAHYSPVGQDFWSAAEYAYRLAGMF